METILLECLARNELRELLDLGPFGIELNNAQVRPTIIPETIC